MPQLQDAEFGSITLRRSALARGIRLKMDGRGVISISMPRRASIRTAKQLLEQSRAHLRKLLNDAKRTRPTYHAGQLIGKSHRLRFAVAPEYRAQLASNELVVHHPAQPDRPTLEATLHAGIKKALRRQAEAYLPRRLEYLAEKHGFAYQSSRLSSAGTRWGSCSSNGTISLNIWLMQLPFELIDYVIVHELCHTQHMNHSPAFWGLVEQFCPEHKRLKRQLKQFQPSA